jgi:hypothetical protein
MANARAWILKFEPGKTVTDAAIKKCGQASAAGTLPGKTASALYFVFFRPARLINWLKSCASFCGYPTHHRHHFLCRLSGLRRLRGGLAI